MPVTEGFELERNFPDVIQGESPMPPSQKVGEFSFRVKGADQTVVLSLGTIPRTSRGQTNIIILSIKNKVGTQPTSVDIELFDTDVPAEMVASSDKSIFRNTGLAIDASDPQLLFSQLVLRAFRTKGAEAKLGARLITTGGAGDTDYEFTIQVNGDRR